jgi:hypothetical protein
MSDLDALITNHVKRILQDTHVVDVYALAGELAEQFPDMTREQLAIRIENIVILLHGQPMWTRNSVRMGPSLF